MSESSLFDSETPIHLPQHTPTSESINAAIYVRTSPRPKPGQGYSLEEQLRICWKRCEALGWTVTYVYRDVDESGKDRDRPEFQQMLQDIQYLDIDVVVFWKLDRFSRTLMDAVELEAELRDHDVALHSVTEFLDTTTTAGRFSFRSIASAAEFERELIQDRSQLWIRNAANERKWPSGTPPLGYGLDDDNKLDPDDEEVQLVRKIFELYRELRSMPEVASELNEAGYETKNGNEWTDSAVGEILRNELYTGRYQVGHVDEHVEEYQIIESDLFEEVKEIRYRFQSDPKSKRGEMGDKRKEEHIENVTQQYLDFIEYQ